MLDFDAMYVILEREESGKLREIETAEDAVGASRKIAEWLCMTGAELPNGSRVKDTDHVLLRALPVPSSDLPVGTRSAFAAYLLRDGNVVDVGAVLIEKWALITRGSTVSSASNVRTPRRRDRK